jgi:hypothetical protein
VRRLGLLTREARRAAIAQLCVALAPFFYSELASVGELLERPDIVEQSHGPTEQFGYVVVGQRIQVGCFVDYGHLLPSPASATSSIPHPGYPPTAFGGYNCNGDRISE